jgi:hypothetical protein
MKQQSRSAAERQLARQLQQAAAAEAASIAPLSWPLSAKKTRPWWQFTLVPVATAAALGWFALSQQSVMPVPTDHHDLSRPPMLIAENYHLEALDQRIQQAYLQAADDHTIAQLWQQRHYWTEQQRISQERITQEWTQ